MQEKSISPHLRRENRIRTIHSSLAIEHNSLSLEQVSAIIDGKRILGNPTEIKEVQNAYEAYELMLKLDPLSVKDLLKALSEMGQGQPQDGDNQGSDSGESETGANGQCSSSADTSGESADTGQTASEATGDDKKDGISEGCTFIILSG